MGNTVGLYRLLGSVILAGTVAGSLAPVATANETQSSSGQEILVADNHRDDDYYEVYPDVNPLPTIPQAFNEALYSHQGNFFNSHGILPSLGLIFGIPNYPENLIANDGEEVNRLYQELMQQQASAGPLLRTPDLPNPFTGSVLTTPLVITEEPITPAPFPTIRRRTTEAPAAPGRGTTTPARPVPGLW